MTISADAIGRNLTGLFKDMDILPFCAVCAYAHVTKTFLLELQYTTVPRLAHVKLHACMWQL